jgi:cell division protein FtsI/penicillin-binding protein 2
MKQEIISRIHILFWCVVAVALLLVFRLYYVQVLHGNSYAEIAQRQYMRSNDRLFNRGTIYYTTKDNELISGASISYGYTLAVSPKAMVDDMSVYEPLLSLVGSSKQELQSIKSAGAYTVLKKRVTDITELEKLSLPGVILEREQWRTYPYETLSSQTLGFIGYDANDAVVGRAGIEQYYEATLARDNSKLFRNFFAQLFSNIDAATDDTKYNVEGDIVTTLEPRVSAHLKEEIEKIHQQYQSEETGALVMDTLTGEIVAMEATPSFNPNSIAPEDLENLQNPLVQKRYEFGSIIKPLTIAVALDAKVISKNSTYTDTGCVTLNEEKVCNYDKLARGVVDVQTILGRSLNVGIAHVVSLLPYNTLTRYFETLSMNDVTGIDVPGEIRGTIDNITENPSEMDVASAGFGQGIAQTPLGALVALSSLAREGSVQTPRIVDYIKYSSGITRSINEGEPVQVFSKKTTDTVTEMLVNVADDYLLKGKVKIDTMSVAAKTGTAQIINDYGRYDEHRFMHSIFGYFPASKPRYIILMYTRAPKGVEYASETLGEPFMDFVKFLIQYYAIPPDR